MSFYAKLASAWREADSMLCVGLDPDLSKIPAHLRRESLPLFSFNKALIDATAPFACAYKPQFAYYAGQDRLEDLAATMDYLRTQYPSKVSILDAKRGDIGSTALMYAKEAFEIFQADSVTVNPYMGGDTLEPFTSFTERGTIVLCRTSNPGSGELQSLALGGQNEALYETVARLAQSTWNTQRNLALVIGATYPEELKRVREIAPDLPFLVPGVGAQGGDLKAVLKHGRMADGYGLLINSSRGIMYAGGGEAFAEAAAAEAKRLTLAMRG
jgi:orotidine-5'-phosphate decarboxylase